MRAVLARLLQDVMRAESRLAQRDTAKLVEINEQLVVAAVTSQAHAETAVQALQVALPASKLDALTGLPNRITLIDRLEQAMAHAKRHNSRCAALFVDLDHFKQLNDAHGHAFGDKVLQQAARRMLCAVRAEDTVSRFGGDEFVVILADMNQPQDARAVAEKLIAAISSPPDLDGAATRVTASEIGRAHV